MKSSGYYHLACIQKQNDEKAEKLQKKKEGKEAKAEKDKKPCAYCNGGFESELDIVKRGNLVFHQNCLDEYFENSTERADIVARERTCPRCKEKVNPLDLDSIDTNIATLHKSCYDALQRSKKNREELTDYISLKYNIPFPNGYMLKQITDYHNQRGYSYKAMLVTLKYIFDVEKIPTKEGVGIGLIPFYFEKAKSHHRKLKNAGNSAQDIKINNTIVKIKAIAPSKRTKAGYIDLNSL